MANGLLYSTNTFLKYYINSKYRADVHYVWCSEYFDSAKAPVYSPGSLTPPTSNPIDIYRDLLKAVASADSHNPKILEQRLSLVQRAIDWELTGKITANERDEIIYIVEDRLFFNYWRPLLYVIPRAKVVKRLQDVPPSKRAGLGNEYIIPDLKGSEFDRIEF